MFRSGQKVGLYTLIEKLGRGGFGEVWLAEKRSQFVTKRVAVKLPHEEQVNFEAIHQEATLWEQASGHPNVLPIIDADVYDGQVVIVSEYADGGSLADKLKREEKLSVKHSVEMAIGILSGLEFLHNRKIIHRDIKPQNILLQGNTPRLADFGISRAMNTTVVSSTIIGTDAYMSPESFDGKRNAQTDIWSVGVVLYQLLKGSLPFPQEHPSERMFAVLTKEFEPLPGEIPSDLKRIVNKALEKEPEKRYQAAEDMREDLQKSLIGIAHPTLARTEVLNRSALPVETSEVLTIQTSEPAKQTDVPTVALNNLTDVNEIKTVFNKVPVNQYSNQPAPTQEAFQQNSVVTQFEQTPFTGNNVQPIQKQDLANVKSISGIRKWTGWCLAGIMLIIFMITIYSFINTGIGKLTPFSSGGKVGYQDSMGRTIISPKYDEAEPFNNGLGRVKLNKKFGYIDSKGVEVIPVKFEYIDFNYDGEKAILVLNGRFVSVNKYGKETDAGPVAISPTK